jgi:hypothetical protein
MRNKSEYQVIVGASPPQSPDIQSFLPQPEQIPLRDVKRSLSYRSHPFDILISNKEETMVLEETNTIHSPWNLLQQPAHPSLGMNASFRTLLAAIDQGWMVEEPVQVLPSVRNLFWIYCFSLTNPKTSQNYCLFVPAVPEVESFVEQNNYPVVEGSC